MFSFTWLFRLCSKNHSNFNRLWISPSFFTAKRDLPLISGRLHSGTPTETLQTVWSGSCREMGQVLQSTSSTAASVLCRQTHSLVFVCLFLSHLGPRWCVKICAVNFVFSSFWIWWGSQNFLWFVQANLFKHHECWNESCVQNTWSVLVIMLHSNHLKNADKM